MTQPPADNAPLLLRVKPRLGPPIRFLLDGRAVEAATGDTLLTAMLLNGHHLRRFEFGDGNRAGYCLMGACQDCWVRLDAGGKVRACTTLVRDGLSVVTGSPTHA